MTAKPWRSQQVDAWLGITVQPVPLLPHHLMVSPGTTVGWATTVPRDPRTLYPAPQGHTVAPPTSMQHQDSAMRATTVILMHRYRTHPMETGLVCVARFSVIVKFNAVLWKF